MPDHPSQSARKLGIFRQAYYATDSGKVRAIAAMLQLAMDKGAGHVVREFLRLQGEQQKQMARMLRLVTPAATRDQMQDELPFAVADAGQLPKAQAESVAGDYARTAGRRAQVFEQLVGIATAGATEATNVLRECLRMEVRQHKLAIRMLQAMTPRSLGSMTTQILNMVDEKPGKLWPFSVIVTRVTQPGNNVEAVMNNAKQALYTLVRDGMIDRVSHGIYRSTKDAE